MTNATFTITPVTNFRSQAIIDGYVYECSCGELYNNVTAAYSCRKCRIYCVFGYCTHVVDIRTHLVVAGEVPSAERYEEARIDAEARWEEERAEYEFQKQMWMQEGELYEAEMQRQREEAERAAAELHEDQLWDIQDRLMGAA